MTEPIMGASQVSGGAGGMPILPASPDATVPSPDAGKALETALQKIKWLEGEVNTLKSDKDKGVAKVAKEVVTLSEQFKKYDKLRARGMEPEDIERQFELDALLAERRGASGTSVPSGMGGNQSQSAGDLTAVLLSPMGLLANDPEVIKIQRDEVDPLQQVVKFANLAQQRQAAQATPPNPAIVASAGTGVTVSTTTEALLAEYNNMTKNIPLGERGVDGRYAAKLAIRKKADEAGVMRPI